MAIYLNGEIKLLYSSDDGSYDFYESRVIDLKSIKVTKSNDVVLYAPNDIKRLARVNKITYVKALQFFDRVGIDDHNGAGIYIPKSQNQGTKNERPEAGNESRN